MATSPSFDPASVEAIAELLSTCMYRSWYSELVAAGLPIAAVVTGHKFQLNIDIGDDAARSSRQDQYTQAIDAIEAHMDSRDAPPEEFVVVGLALSTVISELTLDMITPAGNKLRHGYAHVCHGRGCVSALRYQGSLVDGNAVAAVARVTGVTVQPASVLPHYWQRTSTAKHPPMAANRSEMPLPVTGDILGWIVYSTMIYDGLADCCSRVAAGVRRGEIAPEIALAIVLSWNQYTSTYAKCMHENANVADAIAGAFRQLDRGVRLQLPPVIV